MPALKVNDEVITESGVVAQFLADAHPSHLVPASDAPGGALRRARISFFADTFIGKFHSHLLKIIWSTKTAEEAAEAERAAVAAAVKELEPLLADAAPFFGGSDKLTLAEVGSLITNTHMYTHTHSLTLALTHMHTLEYSHTLTFTLTLSHTHTYIIPLTKLQVLTGSFVQRLVICIEAGGVYSDGLGPSLQEQAPNFWKWAKAVAVHPSVTGLFEEAAWVEWTKAKIASRI